MNAGNIIDIIIGVIALISICAGATKGLFKSILSIVVLVAAIFGSVFVAGLVSEPVTEFVFPYVEDKAEQIAGVVKDATSGKYIVSEDSIEKFEALGIDKEKLTVGSLIPEESIKEIAVSILTPVVKGVLIILLFVLIWCVLTFLVHLMDEAIKNTKIIKGANSTLGAALGLIEILAVAVALVYVLDKFGISGTFKEPLSQSYVYTIVSQKILPIIIK